MNVMPENIIYNELIGLKVSVVGSTDPSLLGVSGTVVDETANMLVVSVSGSSRRKMIPKMLSRFSFFIPEEVVVEGREIALSPEERLKRLQRRH
ncbi:MAG: ribonuclease P protein component 1 [Candidatus Methanosuratincola sp.]|jgi:ribonuclease P protein subunit POP4|nr:ribonuclease P protein subunit [Candidatus Methanosuratincola sp.]